MRFITRPLSALVKSLVLTLIIGGAARAQDVLRSVDPSDLAWWTWGFILAFSSIGWAIAELDKLAEILEPDGMTRQQRLRATLKFGQGYLASLFAGIGTYFVAKVAPGWIDMHGEIPEMLILLFIAAAAFGGTRFLHWLLARVGFARPQVP